MKEMGQGVMRKGKIAKNYKCNQLKSKPEGVTGIGGGNGNGMKREGSEGRLPLSLSLNATPSQGFTQGMGSVNDGNKTETRKLLRMMSARNESS